MGGRGALVAGAAGLCVFLNSLHGELIFDDLHAVIRNEDVRGGNPMARVWVDDFWGTPMASNSSHKSYRPITVLSFRANHCIHGLDPTGYHVVNVLLHAIVSAVAAPFYARLLGDERAAELAALLFALHPVHTEAVASVVGRAELLSALLAVLSVLAMPRLFGDAPSEAPHSSQSCAAAEAAESTGAGPERWGRVVGAGALGVASSLCKETGATVLLFFFAVDLLGLCAAAAAPRRVPHGVAAGWGQEGGGGTTATPSAGYYIHLSIYPSIYLSIYLSIHPSIHPSIYLSICSSIHVYVGRSAGRIAARMCVTAGLFAAILGARKLLTGMRFGPEFSKVGPGGQAAK